MDTKISRNLSIKQIRAFVSVARHKSFSQAALSLSISQPALTLNIQQLETIIGTALFIRNTRYVSLSQSGQHFLPKAEKLLNDIDSSILSTRAYALKQKDQVRVAALPSVAIRVLPEATRVYAEQSPLTRFITQDDNARGVQAQVLNGEADFGISNIWNPEENLNFIPFMQDKMGLIFHHDHPLAQLSAPLEWQCIEDMRFVGMSSDTGISRLTMDVKGLPSSVQHPSDTVLTIAALVGKVGNSEAVSALPALASPDYLNKSLVYRELSVPTIYRQLFLITPKNRPMPQAAQLFTAFLQEIAPKICSMFPNNTVIPPD